MDHVQNPVLLTALSKGAAASDHCFTACAEEGKKHASRGM